MSFRLGSLERAFPDEDYLECLRLAMLVTQPQEPFGWDLEQVRRLFGNQGANFPDGPLLAELPFRVQVGEYYLINPSEDSTDPFWIGRCCAVGTIVVSSFLCYYTCL